MEAKLRNPRSETHLILSLHVGQVILFSFQSEREEGRQMSGRFNRRHSEPKLDEVERV